MDDIESDGIRTDDEMLYVALASSVVTVVASCGMIARKKIFELKLAPLTSGPPWTLSTHAI
jgi:hypothetical protein